MNPIAEEIKEQTSATIEMINAALDFFSELLTAVIANPRDIPPNIHPTNAKSQAITMPMLPMIIAGVARFFFVTEDPICVC